MSQHRQHPPDNGGPHATPPSGLPVAEFRKLPPDEQMALAYEAAVTAAQGCQCAAEEQTATRQLVDRAVIHARHADELAGATREDMRAMRAAVTGLSGQVHELRTMTNQRLTAMGDASERIEGALLVELSRFGAGFIALEKRVQKTEHDAAQALEVSVETEEWASKSGQHHMTELQMRASRGEAFIEDVARQRVAVEVERKQAVTKTVAQVVAGLFTVGGIGTLIVIALTRGCGG